MTYQRTSRFLSSIHENLEGHAQISRKIEHMNQSYRKVKGAKGQRRNREEEGENGKEGNGMSTTTD